MEYGDGKWIYIVECQDNSYYVGMSKKDIIRRLSDHIKGVGSLHIKHNKWKRLLRCWLILEDLGAVYRLENYIKRLRKKDKEDIVAYPEKLELRIRKNLNWHINIQVYETRLIEEMIIKQHPELIDYFKFDQ